jgi:hypothetical protein
MRENLISRRKVLLLAGLAAGLAVPASAMLTASAAEGQQDTIAPPATPGAETAGRSGLGLRYGRYSNVSPAIEE